MSDTLVLDISYRPLGRISWERAIKLLFQDKVEVVDEYEDKTVRSQTLEWKVPSIIRFLKLVNPTKKAIKFSRENVYARDKGKCQYCGIKVPRHKSTYDHVIPKSKGGKTNWKNIVISCFSCNQHKGSRTPEEAKMTLLQKPVMPKSLPGTLSLTFIWREGMPKSWKDYLYDISYWHGELESD